MDAPRDVTRKGQYHQQSSWDKPLDLTYRRLSHENEVLQSFVVSDTCRLHASVSYMHRFNCQRTRTARDTNTEPARWLVTRTEFHTTIDWSAPEWCVYVDPSDETGAGWMTRVYEASYRVTAELTSPTTTSPSPSEILITVTDHSVNIIHTYLYCLIKWCRTASKHVDMRKYKRRTFTMTEKCQNSLQTTLWIKLRSSCWELSLKLWVLDLRLYV